MTAGLLATSILVVAVGIGVALWWRRSGEARREFADYCERVGVHCSGLRAQGLYENIPYLLSYRPARLGHDSVLRITLACRSPFDFLSRRRNETTPDGIATGDLELDRKVWLASENPPRVLDYFSGIDQRRALGKLHELGWSEVRLTHAALEAQWTPFELHEKPNPIAVSAGVAYLADLLKVLPAATRLRRPVRPRTRRLLDTQVPGLLFLLGSALSFYGVVTFPVLDWRRLGWATVLLGMPLWLVYATGGIALLKRGVPEWSGAAKLALRSLFAIPLCVSGVFLVANGFDDKTAPAVYSAVAIDKLPLSGIPYVKLPLRAGSWRGREGRRIVWAAPDVYPLIAPNAGIVVVTRPGRLGFEWVDKVSLLNPSIPARR